MPLYCTDDGSITFGGHNRYFEADSVLLTAEEARHLALNVLPVYAERMHENAATMRDQALVITEAKLNGTLPAPRPGHIDITPEPDGLRRLIPVFTEQAEKAQKLARQLQGEDL